MGNKYSAQMRIQVYDRKKRLTENGFYNALIDYKEFYKYTWSCSDRYSKIDKGKLVLVLCRYSSRVGVDFDSATEELLQDFPRAPVAVIVVHDKDKLPFVRTRDKLIDEKYEKFHLIVDFAYDYSNKIYKCDMNKIGYQESIDFIKRHENHLALAHGEHYSDSLPIANTLTDIPWRSIDEDIWTEKATVGKLEHWKSAKYANVVLLGQTPSEVVRSCIRVAAESEQANKNNSTELGVNGRQSTTIGNMKLFVNMCFNDVDDEDSIVNNVTLLLKGHIPMDYALSHITPATKDYIKQPKDSDRAHLVVFCIKAFRDTDQLQSMQWSLWRTIFRLQGTIKALGIPWIFLLTHVEGVCRDITNIFHSKSVEKAVRLVAVMVGKEESYIHPVGNYECDTPNDKRNVPVWLALRQMRNLLNDFHQQTNNSKDKSCSNVANDNQTGNEPGSNVYGTSEKAGNEKVRSENPSPNSNDAGIENHTGMEPGTSVDGTSTKAENKSSMLENPSRNVFSLNPDSSNDAGNKKRTRVEPGSSVDGTSKKVEN